MQIHVVIPARFASARLPGKPLHDIAGVPMVVRVAQRAAAALPGQNVVVATDHGSVYEVVRSRGISCVMTRDNHVCGSDRIAEVAKKLSWSNSDIVLNIQGDEPAIPIEMLAAFWLFCKNAQALEMGTIVAPLESSADLHNPNVVKVVVNKHGDACYFSRAAIPVHRDIRGYDNWPVKNYLRHVGVYAYRLSVLHEFSAQSPVFPEEAEKLEQLRILWMGFRISTMLWNESPPTGVDTPEDASRISNLFSSGAIT